MRAALLILFVLLFVPLSAQTLAAPDVDSDEENPRYLLAGQADQAIAEGKYDEAVARLIEAISICPNCPDNALLLSNLGMVYAYDNKDSLALDALDRALEIAPAMRTVQANRARVLLKMGRDEQAYQAYTGLLAVDSLNIDARYYRGMMALYRGDANTAEGDFQVLRDSLPLDMETARALSALYSLTGRNSQAVPYFRRLIESEPSAEYYAALAGCYLADRKFTDASAVIGEGLNLYPNDGELYYYRAWLNRDLFRPAEARSDARLAEEFGVDPRRTRALFEQ